MWIYFETDGDAGYYNIKLFKTKKEAKICKARLDDAYGDIEEIQFTNITTIKDRKVEEEKERRMSILYDKSPFDRDFFPFKK